MKWIYFPAALAAIVAVAACGCAQRILPDTVAYLPPSYYSSMETTPEELIRAYTVQYGDPVRAAAQYNDRPFVFKSINVAQLMLVDENTFFYQTIKFTPLAPGDVGKLKTGDVVDIVGINRGRLEGYPLWLYVTDCIFLPAGSVALPAAGGSAFAPMY